MLRTEITKPSAPANPKRVDVEFLFALGQLTDKNQIIDIVLQYQDSKLVWHDHCKVTLTGMLNSIEAFNKDSSLLYFGTSDVGVLAGRPIRLVQNTQKLATLLVGDIKWQ
jgi:hypothetical protein